MRNIVEYPDFAYAPPVLGPTQTPQFLDPAAADFLGLVPQMRFQCSSNGRADMCSQALEIFNCFWSKDDIESHSGQIIARITTLVKMSEQPHGLPYPGTMPIPPQLWSFTERHQRFFEAKECLAADHSRCSGRIVRAHIIARSQLKQIARNGHVVAVPNSLLAVMRMQRTGFKVEEIGVGEFSTMNCFCADHDKTLFAPIEDALLNFSSQQLALLHYRAIAAEFHQRRNQQESAASELDWESDKPPDVRFSWIDRCSRKASEEAYYALFRTEKLIAARRFEDVGSLVVRFDAPPAVMSVGAFRPQYDFAARRVQNFALPCCYLAMHLLAADGAAVLAFTWLRANSAAEQFVRSFAARAREQMASLAVQCAFEHIEHTCMSDTWWSNLERPMRAALLERVRRANSLAYRRSPRCLSYRIPYADWPVADVR
ncbi:hypothetical protein [Bradyrhizobium sp. SSUT77]|uniref:hypothetical protein n=1 Tax=Bradyrhizobium sp. SSUT77 TaxID=3040603 RepID=UPI00244BFBD6|nr:hypothetical protein [Bradyrhizobium sp. SSUT77]MDH2342757.1 hypothetical protein [Bradyrhizobium sp. SSUT77]